jgi:hypothetical protein
MTFTCAPVGGRVLVVLLAILVSVLANATCGWFLLMPTTLTPDERNDRDWPQSSVFDSARECQDMITMGTRAASATDYGTILRRPIENLSEDERRARFWLLARCVPARSGTIGHRGYPRCPVSSGGVDGT